MTTDYRDTPIEKRVADLRSQPDLGYDTATERAQELEFLEEYLKWKADGGARSWRRGWRRSGSRI